MKLECWGHSFDPWLGKNRILQVVQCGGKVRPKAHIVEMEWEGNINIKVESVGHGDRMLS